MRLIKDNPYRTVGLLVGAKAAEQTRQISRLRMYLEAEQEPQDDFSFPVLGTLRRTVESVTEAASKLNLDQDKMNAALFWFFKGNEITDEPAFEALKEAETQSAMEIWFRLVSSGEVTQRNYSAFQNISTLLLCNSFNGTSVNFNFFAEGISKKLKFLESDFVNDLKALATDETFQPAKKDIQLSFLTALYGEIESNAAVTSLKFIEILSRENFSAKEEFLKSLVQKPIEKIEKKVEAAKTKRKGNKANAADAGMELYDEVVSDLNQLKSIFGTNHMRYSSVADKVSDEILQCGIDYFLHYRDTDTDPGLVSMGLFKEAEIFAVGNITKQRCQENIESLQEWIDDKPQRDKQTRILADLEKLKNLINEYERRNETAENGKQLLAGARPFLNNIKSVLGSTDEFYLGLSSRIASDAQGMCVSEINKLQEKIANAYDNATKIAAILLLKERVNEAWNVTTTIGTMDLLQDFRIRYTQNRTILSNLKNQLAAVNTGRASGSSSGCYIATMAYGDYDHPQVMILRQFRDEVLDKSAFGKWLIKIYYHYSPKLVENLKSKKVINSIIRKTLNQFIKLIK